MPFLQYCQILTEIVDRALDSKDKKEYTSKLTSFVNNNMYSFKVSLL